MCGFPTSCLEIQLLALVGLDVMVCHVLARKCREVCALFSISGSGGRAG